MDGDPQKAYKPLPEGHHVMMRKLKEASIAQISRQMAVHAH